jgi:hypothetical protein
MQAIPCGSAWRGGLKILILFNSTLRNCPPPMNSFIKSGSGWFESAPAPFAAVNSQVQESKDQHAAGTVELVGREY